MSEHVFRAGFLFAGLGAGARGFDLAEARLGSDVGRFVNVGGIDFDEQACADYERIAAGPATCADISAMGFGDMRRALGEESPDVVFTSPPCKGHSGLLSQEKAETDEYQEMNGLVLKGINLLCSTWRRPPGLIVLENVPRVVSRGATWLIQVRQVLAAEGYVFHEEAHDLRKIGDLGAHRRRYLLVARHPARVPGYVFRPPLKPGKSCGDILAELPLPETEGAGPMHRLPRLSLLNWIRLALIPPGGDWRDLPGMRTKGEPNGRTLAKERDDERGEVSGDAAGRDGAGVAVVCPGSAGSGGTGGASGIRGDGRKVGRVRSGVHPGHPGSGVAVRGIPTADGSGGPQRASASPGRSGDNRTDETGAQRVIEQLALDHSPRRGTFGVTALDEPAATVRGRADVRTGPAAVADDRVAVTQRDTRFSDQYRMQAWERPAGTVTGATDVQEGAPLVADPRIAPGATGRDDGKWKDRPGYISVADWEKPTRTITVKASVSGGCGVGAVADPRIAPGVVGDNAGSYKGRPRYIGVEDWNEPAHTIIGNGRVATGSGTSAVADPRIPLGNKGPAFNDILKIGDWNEPAPAVTGAAKPHGGAAVADPRLGIDHSPRAGSYEVGAWNEAARTVNGASAVGKSNGPQAVADPRIAEQAPTWGGGRYGVADWQDPSATVCGESYPSNGAASVADPRVALGAENPGRHENKYRVTPFDEPAGTVCGTDQGRVGSGAPVVADPRVPLACGGENTHTGLYHVDDWQDAAKTVTGATRPGGGAASVGDPRIGITCTPRTTSGAYGVLDPTRPAYAVTGHGQIDNGPLAIADGRARFGNCDRVTAWADPTPTITHAPAPSSGGAATADPRIAGGAALPPTYRRMTLDEAMKLLDQGVKQLPDNQVPVILSPKDGTWHRPLTDLELAALQGLPATLNGAPLQLAGKSRAKWRERIGNAVPVGAAKAIAETLLLALIAAATGQWVLGSTGIWVRREDGATEYEVAAEMGYSAAELAS